MNIVGLNPYAHDAGVALVVDGRPEFSLEEERLNRVKCTQGFPFLALQELLRSTGLRLPQVDHFVVPWNPFELLRGVVWQALNQRPPAWRLLGRRASPYMNIPMALQMLCCSRELRRVLRTRNLPPVRFLNHHLSHASSAFHLSSFDQAAILVVDGYGDSCSTSTFIAQHDEIRLNSQNRFLDSLGIVYTLVTEHLGFRGMMDEGTVMALAAGGDDTLRQDFAQLIHLLPDGRYEVNRRFFRYQRYGYQEPMSPEFLRLFGPTRSPKEPIEPRHRNIARALQRRLEETLIHISRHLQTSTGLKNLCLGGGSAMNCLAVGRIGEESGFENVYVSPAPGDAGQALGAALWSSRNTKGKTPLSPRSSRVSSKAQVPFLGPEYSEVEIRNALESANSNFSVSQDVAKYAARRIAEGAIVGWFQGRMEMGPRALGHRSLLADPRDATVPGRLNKIKNRQEFRPFSPSVLAEKANRYFELTSDSPYMSFAVGVLDNRRDEIPAVVSTDGTARPQIVRSDNNLLFRELITEFDRITNCPMVVNTSFNVAEPMVCTPTHAINTYMNSAIDVLVMGSFIVENSATD